MVQLETDIIDRQNKVKFIPDYTNPATVLVWWFFWFDPNASFTSHF